MKRIFVAIDIFREARNKVSSYIDDLRAAFPKVRVGWVKAEKLHLTLKFLGDINDEQLERVKEGVAKAAIHFVPFRLRIESTGVFPSAKKARTLWLGLEEKKNNLQEIVNLLETEFKNTGFATEKRNFHPHLTIGRLREPQKSMELVKLHLASQFDVVEFEVTEIVVYESKLLPNGSVYEAVSKVTLDGQFSE